LNHQGETFGGFLETWMNGVNRDERYFLQEVIRDRNFLVVICNNAEFIKFFILNFGENKLRVELSKKIGFAIQIILAFVTLNS